MTALALLGPLACQPADDPLPPPSSSSGGGHGGSWSSGAASETAGSETAGSETAGETGDETAGETGDAGCDPLADPVLECGPNMRCDLETLSCVAANGSGLVDELCELDDDCAPGLACSDARCRELCSPDIVDAQACDDDRICTYADPPVPGLCLEACNMLTPNCSMPGDACKRGLGVGPSVVAVCTANPGAGVEGDACEFDGDCNPGYVCTPDQAHGFPCAGDAPSCCAVVCDLIDLPCFGLEPICISLNIADQPSAGYCGG